jgi:hypothetical protein
MNKVVYNACYGGFSLSKRAVKWLAENGRDHIKAIALAELEQNPNEDFGYHLGMRRHDPDLVRCVETLGAEASGTCACLEIEEIDGNQYRIEEYDGYETVMQPKNYRFITIE